MALIPNEKLKAYCKELKPKLHNNKVVFVNCPQFSLEKFERSVAKNRCYYAYPPTGLQYLYSALNDRELDIKIFDLNYELLKRLQEDENFDPKNWLSIFTEYIEKENPCIVGIANLFHIDNPYLIEISNFLRKREDCLILAGGQNATYNAKKFLREGLCDFVCKRESDNKIKFLFDNLFEDKKNKPTPGILFKRDGEIIESEGENDVVELKGNLIKAHKVVSVEKYYKVGSTSPYSRMAGKEIPYGVILLNRGCSGGCKFCDVCDYMGRGVRSRSVKDILDELEYLYKEKGVKYFELLDDDFTIFRNKTLEVLQGIIDRGLKIKWGSTNGLIALTCNEEILEKMRDTGCLGFKIGVETGNAELLREMRKPGTLDTFREFSKRAQKFPEMFIVDNYILGLPGEKFSQIRDSFNFSFEMNLDWSSFGVYQPNVSFSESEERGNEVLKDFVPGKGVYKGKLKGENILYGRNIFKISKDDIPPIEQLNEIWFAFNLIRNFIFNKNLKENPKKFIKWVSVIEERYPTHPYINFFLALAYCLVDNVEKTKEEYEKMLKNLEDVYWMERFRQFSMDKFINDFPKNKENAEKILGFLRDENEWRMKESKEENVKEREGVLIIGASGLIGNHLYRFLKQKGEKVIGTYNQNKKEGLIYFDMINSSINNLPVDNFKYIIICSAIAQIDKCKEYPRYSNLVNVESTKRIIKEAVEKGMVPVFMSSAAVFDGVKGGYKEDSPMNPIALYGEQKKEVEEFIVKNFKDYLIILPGKVFGLKKGEGVLFRDWLEKYKKREIIECADDEKISPHFVEDVVRGINGLLNKNARGKYNLNPPQFFNRYELAKSFFNYLNIDADIIKCSIDDFNFLEKRAKETYLDSSKFIKETGFEFTPLEECWDRIKEDMFQNGGRK